jgi:hypothetical protein
LITIERLCCFIFLIQPAIGSIKDGRCVRCKRHVPFAGCCGRAAAGALTISWVKVEKLPATSFDDSFGACSHVTLEGTKCSAGSWANLVVCNYTWVHAGEVSFNYLSVGDCVDDGFVRVWFCISGFRVCGFILLISGFGSLCYTLVDSKKRVQIVRHLLSLSQRVLQGLFGLSQSLAMGLVCEVYQLN